jgi:hypothetical protein
VSGQTSTSPGVRVAAVPVQRPVPRDNDNDEDNDNHNSAGCRPLRRFSMHRHFFTNPQCRDQQRRTAREDGWPAASQRFPTAGAGRRMSCRKQTAPQQSRHSKDATAHLHRGLQSCSSRVGPHSERGRRCRCCPSLLLRQVAARCRCL